MEHGWTKKLKFTSAKLIVKIEQNQSIAREFTDQRVEMVAERKVTEDLTEDGTKVRKEITIIKHVKHFKEITLINGEKIDSTDKSEHVGTEVFEDVWEIAPGVGDLTSPEVKSKTREQDINEILKDGTWLKKKVKHTSVKLAANFEQYSVDKKIAFREESG